MDDRAARQNRFLRIGLDFAADLPAEPLDNGREGLLHVNRLLLFVVTPFPVETQDRDAKLVLLVRIDFAIGILVRDHLAASAEADARTVIAPGVFFELLSINR